MTDTAPLADAELDALEALAAAATPGPWWIDERAWESDECSGSLMIVAGDDEDDEIAGVMWARDAAFIAAIRAAVPRLLREVRRLRALERAAEAAWQQTRETIEATREPIPLAVTTITEGMCGWAVPDPTWEGHEMPHGVRARRRVTGAGEFLDGDYCRRHADMAVDYAVRGIAVGP